MPKMSAIPRPEARNSKARTFRSLASHIMSLILGDPFWIACVVWFVIILLSSKSANIPGATNSYNCNVVIKIEN